jgi:hypothetical protein
MSGADARESVKLYQSCRSPCNGRRRCQNRDGSGACAESTQEQRVALGFSANDPLLRTGTLRDSIGHVVEGNVGYVGTNDKVAPFQEFGTSKNPPRPFLGGALAATEQEIPKIFGSGTG